MSEEANEETTERYVMEISNEDHLVSLIDTRTAQVVVMFAGRDRLLRATKWCAEWNRQDAAGIEPRIAAGVEPGTEWSEPEPEAVPVTPRSFLAETLPTFVRNQRQAVWHEFVTPEAEQRAEFAKSSQRAQEAWSTFLRDAGGQIDTMMGLKPAPHATRAQRLAAMLAEVKTAETRALALLAEDARLLNRAASLRKRLETALSATQSAEKAARVGEGAAWVTQTPTARTAGRGDGSFVIEFDSAGLSKPGPY